MANPIEYEHTLDIGRAPGRVFSILDDFERTPKWVARCTGIEKLTAGDNRVGTQLRYAYREGSRTGTMDGEITFRTLNERLTIRYVDKMFEVVVDFRLVKEGNGTRLTHAFTITPLTFMTRLFSFFLRRAIPGQTATSMQALKALIESGNP